MRDFHAEITAAEGILAGAVDGLTGTTPEMPSSDGPRDDPTNYC
jgi:hypothetical protein